MSGDRDGRTCSLAPTTIVPTQNTPFRTWKGMMLTVRRGSTCNSSSGFGLIGLHNADDESIIRWFRS